MSRLWAFLGVQNFVIGHGGGLFTLTKAWYDEFRVPCAGAGSCLTVQVNAKVHALAIAI